MKPKRPLPTRPPFLTIITHTYRRPQGLARCMASIAHQTAVADVEQIVFPDHLGVSPADAVYGRMPWYADVPRGGYVHVLGDDDQLSYPTAVENLRSFVERNSQPALIVVKAVKGGTVFPKCGVRAVAADELEAHEGDVDLCNFVMRCDIWKAFAETYGRAYTCDWDGYLALRQLAQKDIAAYDVVFAEGAEGSGRPELDW